MDQNPSGLAGIDAFAPMFTVMLKSGVLDTEVTPATLDNQKLEFLGIPDQDTQPSNCAIVFPGTRAVNAVICARLQKAELVQALMDARKSEAALNG